jgi:hypothetical protein
MFSPVTRPRKPKFESSNIFHGSITPWLAIGRRITELLNILKPDAVVLSLYLSRLAADADSSVISVKTADVYTHTALSKYRYRAAREELAKHGLFSSVEIEHGMWQYELLLIEYEDFSRENLTPDAVKAYYLPQLTGTFVSEPMRAIVANCPFHQDRKQRFRVNLNTEGDKDGLRNAGLGIWTCLCAGVHNAKYRRGGIVEFESKLNTKGFKQRAVENLQRFFADYNSKPTNTEEAAF